MGRSTNVLGTIKLPPPLNFTFKWEDHDDDGDDDDDDDDDDAPLVVIAFPGKPQEFSIIRIILNYMLHGFWITLSICCLPFALFQLRMSRPAQPLLVVLPQALCGPLVQKQQLAAAAATFSCHLAAYKKSRLSSFKNSNAIQPMQLQAMYCTDQPKA